MPYVIKGFEGRIFGRLTVVSREPNNGSYSRWLCQCVCGKRIITQRSYLLEGKTLSCGCYNRDKATTHGDRKTRFWSRWSCMKRRCIHDKRYRANAVEVSRDWLRYENFKRDMFASYLEHVAQHGEKDTTLDRIDNERGYEVGNCRWATNTEQANNRSTNRFIELNGKRQTLASWGRELNISVAALCYRLNVAGWDVKKSLTTPIR